MIKLLSLLLSLTVANGQNLVYLLPDQHSVFESWLQTTIKKSSQPFYLLTPSMAYPSLEKSLILHQSHGYDFVLITQKLTQQPRALIQYQNTYWFHYRARPLQGSMLIIPPYVCQIALPMDETLFASSTGSILCSDDYDTLNAAQKHFDLIQKRSSPYLK